MTAQELTAAVRRLFGHVSHWTPPRWAAFGVSGVPRRETVSALIQHLADLGAAAEGGPRRVVPAPDSDLVLPDQLRVVADDLIAAAPGTEVLARAATQVTAAHRAL